MNLIIDIGNSSVKIAVFEENKLVTSFSSREFNCESVEKKLAPFKLNRAIVSSVRDLPAFVPDLMTAGIPDVHILTHRSKLPFSVDYDTPATLGTDRIAAAAGAVWHFGSENMLVIDAGTAITYDFISGKCLKGGNISPGIDVRFRALHKFTGRLPLAQRSEKYSFPGRNTNDAIVAGVITGVTYEINEYIRTFEKDQGQARIILTGGDGGFLRSKIDNEITYMPDIVLYGLNYILEYNAE
ncbi:MAG: type III pantothenate kinase [Bacteroidales bacterium]|jgi:type III pantothenate kinase|nr:type III pantothenate kinase [Bacteroidales bacterium]MCU0408193.1 type III pantothenate kinase [Bacteroidales bacterium]